MRARWLGNGRYVISEGLSPMLEKSKKVLWDWGVDLIKLFLSNFTHSWWKLYLFTTQKNNGYIITVV